MYTIILVLHIRRPTNIRRDAMPLKSPVMLSGPAKSCLHLIRNAKTSLLLHHIESLFQKAFGELDSPSHSLNGLCEEASNTRLWRSVTEDIFKLLQVVVTCLKKYGISLYIKNKILIIFLYPIFCCTSSRSTECSLSGDNDLTIMWQLNSTCN